MLIQREIWLLFFRDRGISLSLSFYLSLSFSIPQSIFQSVSLSIVYHSSLLVSFPSIHSFFLSQSLSASLPHSLSPNERGMFLLFPLFSLSPPQSCGECLTLLVGSWSWWRQEQWLGLELTCPNHSDPTGHRPNSTALLLELQHLLLNIWVVKAMWSSALWNPFRGISYDDKAGSQNFFPFQMSDIYRRVILL